MNTFFLTYTSNHDYLCPTTRVGVLAQYPPHAVAMAHANGEPITAPALARRRASDLREQRTREIELTVVVATRLKKWATILIFFATAPVVLFGLLLGKSYFDVRHTIEHAQAEIKGTVDAGQSQMKSAVDNANANLATAGQQIIDIQHKITNVNSDIGKYQAVNKHIAQLQKGLNDLHNDVIDLRNKKLIVQSLEALPSPGGAMLSLNPPGCSTAKASGYPISLCAEGSPLMFDFITSGGSRHCCREFLMKPIVFPSDLLEESAMHVRNPRQPSASGFWIVLAMLAMISVPAAFTLHTVKASAFQPLNRVVAGNPTPFGYSVSLLIFVVPVLAIAFWFFPQEHIHISQRAFWWTVGILFPFGAGLDFFFAQFFFRFPDPDATLRILAPALGHPVPVEEYLFYLTGFLAVLSIYVWLDGYWLHAFAVPEDDARRTDFDRLLGLHANSFFLAVLLIGGAIVTRRIAQPDSPGFPGYLTFLVLTALVPSTALYREVRRVINWRALSLTLFMILLISLLWEATLAIPYGWWSYQPAAMVGLYIRAWDNLPIEAVFVWIAVTYGTVLVYETIRCWHASGRPLGDALFRRNAARVRRPASP